MRRKQLSDIIIFAREEGGLLMEAKTHENIFLSIAHIENYMRENSNNFPDEISPVLEVIEKIEFYDATRYELLEKLEFLQKRLGEKLYEDLIKSE